MSKELKKKRILNISEAERYSGYSRGWIEYWIREGLIHYESPPSQGKEKQKRKYIRRADLDTFIDRYYQCSQPQCKQGKRDTYAGKVTLLPRKM